MNAIVPRKTVEQVVAARDQTLKLYEHAFQKIEEADAALKQARLMWKEASPSMEGRYYDASNEAGQFFKVVTMPDREQYLATARRLVDITVWQHVVEISGIEDLMDKEEKEKLRSQMQYREPKFRSARKFITELERLIDYARENDENTLYAMRSFKREISSLKDDPETAQALLDADIQRIRELSQIMIDLVSKDENITSNSLQELTVSLDDFDEALENKNGLPPVTVDNIMATLSGLLGQSNEIFLRGIANSFSALDRRFRSHDGFKVGSRIIIDRLCDDSGFIRYGRGEDLFIDIERIFKVLDGGKPGSIYGSIINAIRSERGWGAKQSQHTSDFFEVRIFKNGNAHLWFTRKDLVEKVNKCLAEYYGEVIGDGMTQEEDPLKNVKTTPARYYGFFPTPPAAAEKVIESARLHISDENSPLLILEPSAGTGNLSSIAAAERTLIRNHKIDLSNGQHRWESEEVPYKHIVDCIELQPHLANALEADGRYNSVRCADFLQVNPDLGNLYDRVIMNPPFDRERDIDHVFHALKFLSPDGILVAIMSAGTEFRETKKAKAFRKLVIDEMGGAFKDLPPNSFSEVGTNVNTVILTVRKDGSKINPWM